MSILFHISIESTSGSELRARFEVCHPDQWEIPATKGIALATIVETYFNIKNGFGFTTYNQPLTPESAEQLISSHPLQQKMEFWLGIMNNRDGAKFSSEAIDAIADVFLECESSNPLAQCDPDPAATLVVVANDPSILLHVVDGFQFDSAMCDWSLW